MKKIISGVFCLFLGFASYGQESGTINVGGDIDTFYPVTWYDGAWGSNMPTELYLGRSSVHTNSSWRGAMIATFNFHTTNWGNQAHYIDAHIVNSASGNSSFWGFVAGWTDATIAVSSRRIVVWLRGGGTTYYYNSNVSVNPVVYDGEQNSLPYTTPNGSASYNSKTEIEKYVQTSGTVLNHSLHIRSGKSSIMGKLGIGTTNPTEELSVNGNIRAHEIKLETDNWSDFVFEEDYKLRSLKEVEHFIIQHKHLPDIPSQEEVLENGIQLGDMDAKLLQKIEELTLYLIQQQELIKGQSILIEKQQAELERLGRKVEQLERGSN